MNESEDFLSKMEQYKNLIKGSKDLSVYIKIHLQHWLNNIKGDIDLMVIIIGVADVLCAVLDKSLDDISEKLDVIDILNKFCKAYFLDKKGNK